MKYLGIMLLLCVSAMSLATASLPPKSLTLLFSLKGQQVEVALDLSRLHSLVSREIISAEQAEEVLQHINLLPNVSDPLLMMRLLKRASDEDASSYRQKKKFKARRDIGYRELASIWPLEGGNGQIHDEIKDVYHHVERELLRSNELLGLLSSLSRDDHETRLEDQMSMLLGELWVDRIDPINLFSAYGMEVESYKQLFSKDMIQKYEILVNKIVEEASALDSARTEEIKARSEAILSFSKKAASCLSRASYCRAILAEMLDEAGIEGKKEEAQFQHLISDFWTALRGNKWGW